MLIPFADHSAAEHHRFGMESETLAPARLRDRSSNFEKQCKMELISHLQHKIKLALKKRKQRRAKLREKKRQEKNVRIMQKIYGK